MSPIACSHCGRAISPTSFECPYCGAVGPNRSGRESKGLTRGRWTVLCLALLGLALLFPPTRQLGEYSVDGQTRVVDHQFMPSWIGGADAGPDVGYTRNGQLQTITWNITREINRPAWAVVLGALGLAWLIGMMIPRRRPQPAPSRYRQEIVQVAPPSSLSQHTRQQSQPQQQPPRPVDRAVQPPPQRPRTLYPGISVPGDVGSVRHTPPPPGRYR